MFTEMNVTSSATASQRLIDDNVAAELSQTEKGNGATAASTNDNPQSDTIHRGNDDDTDEPFFWRFADLGHIPLVSRDGSPHATDEVFNSVSHLAACILSILGSVLLIAKASTSGALVPWKIVAFSIYGLSLCNLFACSTVHHAVTTTRYYEHLFQLLDYLAIFPLISGTFTPLCLVFMHNSVIGWTFLSVVWAISLLSMIGLAHHFSKVPKWMTMTLYITLGWFGAFLGLYLYPTYLPMSGIALLILGGLWYTVGGYIYTTEQPSSHYLIPGKFGFHELWHIFVIAGAATHWCLMYWYVLPYNPNSTR